MKMKSREKYWLYDNMYLYIYIIIIVKCSHHKLVTPSIGRAHCFTSLPPSLPPSLPLSLRPYLVSQHIFKESRQWEHVLNLSPRQVAEELTRQVSGSAACGSAACGVRLYTLHHFHFALFIRSCSSGVGTLGRACGLTLSVSSICSLHLFLFEWCRDFR